MVSDSERLSLLKKEAAICFDVCKDASLIVFNLFSLEGYFIALHLGIPSLAASPHLLTRYIGTVTSYISDSTTMYLLLVSVPE